MSVPKRQEPAAPIGVSRRGFLEQSAFAAAGTVAGLTLARSAHAAGDDVIEQPDNPLPSYQEMQVSQGVTANAGKRVPPELMWKRPMAAYVCRARSCENSLHKRRRDTLYGTSPEDRSRWAPAFQACLPSRTTRGSSTTPRATCATLPLMT